MFKNFARLYCISYWRAAAPKVWYSNHILDTNSNMLMYFFSVQMPEPSCETVFEEQRTQPQCGEVWKCGKVQLQCVTFKKLLNN